MALQIKEGIEYKARNGEKIGPMERTREGSWGKEWRWTTSHRINTGVGRAWRDDGSFDVYNAKTANDYDLISEWFDSIESPIRTVTRREVVSGLYDKVYVGAFDPTDGQIEFWIPRGKYSATDIRSMLMVMSQLSEVADDSADKEKEL